MTGRAVRLAVVGVVLVWVASLAWYLAGQYSLSRRRALVLQADEPFAVDILPVGSAGPPLRQIQLPQREPIELPEGRYDLRIIGRGELGDTLTVDLDETITSVKLELNSITAMPPRQLSENWELVDLGTKWGLVEFSTSGISFWDAHSAPSAKQSVEPRWQIDLTDKLPAAIRAPGWNWADHRFVVNGAHYSLAPYVVRDAADLDRDGVGDVLLAGTHQAWVLAVSGTTGKVLWFAARGEGLQYEFLAEPDRFEREDDPFADTPQKFEFPFRRAAPYVSQVTAAPLPIDDIDGDGIVDWLVSFHEAWLPQDPSWRQQWLEAFSGASGSTLWRRELPASWFDPSSSRAGWSAKLMGKQVAERLDLPAAEPQIIWKTRGQPPRRVRRGDGWAIALTTPHHVEWLDPKTGEPFDGAWDDRPPALEYQLWHDVDGDGQDDLVFYEQDTTRATELVARSMALGRELWRIEVINHVSQGLDARPHVIRPVLADLNGDGRLDVATVYGDETEVHSTIAVWSDATRAARWTKRVLGNPPALLVGPDLDGDGWRDLYFASATDPFFVDAVSGQDGRTLWSTEIEAPASAPLLRQLAWWHASADGWPQLAARWEARGRDARSVVACLSAGTGRATRMGYDIGRFVMADLDRDSVDEFWTRGEADHARRADVRVTRGLAGVVARLPADARPLGDLDGDGVDDFALRLETVDRYCRTTSATPLFDREISFTNRFQSDLEPLPINRLVSRGRPRAGRTMPVGEARSSIAAVVEIDRRRREGSGVVAQALAGPSGRVAWKASSASKGQVRWVRTHDLDGDGAEELLAVERGDERHIHAFSGVSGARLWTSELAPGGSDLSYLDVDGDGFDDVLYRSGVVWQEEDRPLEFHAVSGRDGSSLWTFRPDLAVPDAGGPFDRDTPTSWEFVPGPDGAPPQIVVHFAPVRGVERLLAIDAQTGNLAWQHAKAFPVGATSTSEGTLSSGVWRDRGTSVIRGRSTDHPYSALAALRSSRGAGSCAWWTASDCDSWFRFNTLGEVERLPSLIPADATKEPAYFELAAVDLDGDGSDELVFLRDVQLWAIDPRDPTSRRWTLDMTPWISRYDFQEKIPDRQGAWSHWLFRCPRPPHRVIGVDLRQGRVDWLLPILETPERFFDDLFSGGLLSQFLGPLGSETPPYFAMIQDSKRVDIQQAHRLAPRTAPRDSDPRVLDERWRAWEIARRPVPAALQRDPRWRRPLPWAASYAGFVPAVGKYTQWGEVTPWGWRLAFSGALVVAPGWYLAWVVRQRRFSLRQLLTLPALAGLVLTLAPMTAPLLAKHDDFELSFVSRYVNFGMGSEWLGASEDIISSVPVLLVLYAPPAACLALLLYAPSAACLAQLFGGSARRRWNAVAAYCGLLVGATLLAAGWALLRDSWADHMLPEMYYATDGWPLVLCDGLFFAGWGLVVGWGAKFAWRLAANVLSRWRRKRSPPPSGSPT